MILKLEEIVAQIRQNRTDAV